MQIRICEITILVFVPGWLNHSAGTVISRLVNSSGTGLVPGKTVPDLYFCQDGENSSGTVTVLEQGLPDLVGTIVRIIHSYNCSLQFYNCDVIPTTVFPFVRMYSPAHENFLSRIDQYVLTHAY